MIHDKRPMFYQSSLSTTEHQSNLCGHTVIPSVCVVLRCGEELCRSFSEKARLQSTLGFIFKATKLKDLW